MCANQRKKRQELRANGSAIRLVNAVAQKTPAAGFAPKFVLDNFDIAIGIKKGEPRLLAKLNDWILLEFSHLGFIGEDVLPAFNVNERDCVVVE